MSEPDYRHSLGVILKCNHETHNVNSYLAPVDPKPPSRAVFCTGFSHRSFNSTKSYTGHTLAAAGAIEAVYSILSINNNELFPSLNCKTPIEPFNEFPIKAHKKAEIKTVLSNSFGFGGNCSSLIIRES